jgi:hypothetical protein
MGGRQVKENLKNKGVEEKVCETIHFTQVSDRGEANLADFLLRN